MKITLKLFALALLASVLAFGQGTALGTTTLSSAITTPNQTTINLSTTNMTGQAAANQFTTAIYVDRELMLVTTVVDSTHAVVQRGQRGSRPFVHASGAKVYFGPLLGNFLANTPAVAESWGSCLIANEPTLPKIYVTTGDVMDCNQTGAAGTAGQWMLISNGTMAPHGGRISGFCTGTVGSAETEFLNGAACSGATTATARQIITQPGTLSDFRVVSSAAWLGTGSSIAKVVLNGTATTIVCSPVAAGTTCSDTLHSVAVVPGDVITFSFLSATSDTAANVSAAVAVY